jgi:hypothetical protein
MIDEITIDQDKRQRDARAAEPIRQMAECLRARR